MYISEILTLRIGTQTFWHDTPGPGDADTPTYQVALTELRKVKTSGSEDIVRANIPRGFERSP